MPQPKKIQRPRIDAICRHIKAGSYDDDMSQLQGAIVDRQRIRQEAVLGLVKEVFGEEYVVEQPKAKERKNPFLPKSKDPDLADAERRAAEQEEQLRKDAVGDGSDEEIDSDYESRSPIIGSIGDTPETSTDQPEG